MLKRANYVETYIDAFECSAGVMLIDIHFSVEVNHWFIS